MKSKRLVYTALFIALGIIFPSIFHLSGLSGKIFLPMHIPVILGGMVLGPISGMIIGILTPILSSILTGMPPAFPMLPIMIVELLVYGLVSGYISYILGLNNYVSLVISMILGRLSAGFVAFILSNLFNLDLGFINYIRGSIITGFPGIILQIILIPLIVKLISKKARIDA